MPFTERKKYDEAVPYLEAYNKNDKNHTRLKIIAWGMPTIRVARITKPLVCFDRVKKVKDSLGQVAYYHLGECLLKLNNTVFCAFRV